MNPIDTSTLPAMSTTAKRRAATLVAPDTLSQRGAMALARRLEDYWHRRQFPAARFWAEPIVERFAKVGSYEIYRVACNLVNGLPPRYHNERTQPAPAAHSSRCLAIVKR